MSATFSKAEDSPSRENVVTKVNMRGFRPNTLAINIVYKVLGRLRRRCRRVYRLAKGGIAHLANSKGKVHQGPLVEELTRRVFGVPVRVPRCRRRTTCKTTLATKGLITTVWRGFYLAF